MAVTITGGEKIAAPVPAVWAALHDPETLRSCVRACEKLERTADGSMAATLAFKMGPLRVTFLGTIRINDTDPPHAMSISGEGKGGIAGFAKGSADVRLREAGPRATDLSYTATLDAGGRIAQLGGKLIESTARAAAAAFFARLAARIKAQAASTPAVEKPSV